METFNESDYDQEMNQSFHFMTAALQPYSHRPSDLLQQCVVCGSKSIGINFGVHTCAPCKAFFRRNARRKDILNLPCRHRDLRGLMRDMTDQKESMIRYLQENLVRTDEENERYRKLIEINRRQRELVRQQADQLKQLSIPRYIMENSEFSLAIDWTHLSNIVYAYDTYCLQTYKKQCQTTIFNSFNPAAIEQPTTITMSIALSVSTFFKALPAYNSLPRLTQNHLCKTNIRPLIFPSLHELNQSCFSEPWQIASYKATWQLICGPQLYEQFDQAEQLARKTWVTDPVVTRLFVIVLFFSTPLHYHYDCPSPTPVLKKKAALYQAQNAYTSLLWKYLVHRHGYLGSVEILMHLIHVYLKMQRVGYGMYTHLRSQKDLLLTHKTLDNLVTCSVHKTQEKRERVLAKTL